MMRNDFEGVVQAVNEVLAAGKSPVRFSVRILEPLADDAAPAYELSVSSPGLGRPAPLLRGFCRSRNAESKEMFRAVDEMSKVGFWPKASSREEALLKIAAAGSADLIVRAAGRMADAVGRYARIAGNTEAE